MKMLLRKCKYCHLLLCLWQFWQSPASHGDMIVENFDLLLEHLDEVIEVSEGAPVEVQLENLQWKFYSLLSRKALHE